MRALPTHTRARAALVLAAAACVALPLAAEAKGPANRQHRQPRQELSSYTPRFVTPIAPGVELSGYTSASRGGTADSNVVSVDLSRPGVSTGVLVGRVTDTAAVSDLAERQGAVAGVNGDYYAIGGSQAPQGPVVRDGALLKGTSDGQFLAGVGVDGVARLARVFLEGTASWGGGPSRQVHAYNSDLYGSRLPRDGVALLDGGWGDRPLTFVGPPAKVGVVAVDGSGRVVDTWTRAAGQRVPPGGLLLVGTGRWSSVAGLPRGSKVNRQIGLRTDAPAAFRWGLGVGLSLVSSGVVTHHFKDDSDPYAARTALGWKDGGRTLLVVTVERTPTSAGQGVNAIADEMAALGATDAVLLDGGGSTTLVARARGESKPALVGAQEDGYQRPVPVGIGVFVPRGSGSVLGLQSSLDAGVVFPGLHRRLSFRGWDEWFGPAVVDPATVAITSDAAGLAIGDGPGLVKALRPGTGRVISTAPAPAPGAAGPASHEAFLRVLGPLTTLAAPGEIRLAPGSSTSFAVQGSDGTESAPVDGMDLAAQTDPRFVVVTTEADGRVRLTAKPGTEGGISTVTLHNGAASAKVLVRNGFKDVPLVDPGAAGAFRVTGGRGKVVPLGRVNRGLRLAPSRGGATAATSSLLPLPTGAQRLGITVIGDGRPHTVQVLILDSSGRAATVGLGTTTTRGPRRMEAALPPGAGSLVAVQVTAAPGSKRGSVVLDGLVARV